MKKLILVLAILVIAAPAFAALSIDLRKDANDVNIVYTGGDPNNLPRAFALRIQLVAGSDPCDPCIVIKAIDGYKTGESNSTKKGYGIFPARVVIDTCGVVTDWGSPLADSCDPGGSLALPSKNIILELGSLYPANDYNKAPDPCGELCELVMDCNGSVGDINIVLTDESTYRGGVVLENGTAASSFTKTLKYSCGTADCLTVGKVFSVACANGPAVNLTVTAAMVTKWNYLGKPQCWCCDFQKCGNGVYTGASKNRVDTVDFGDVQNSWFKWYTQVGYKPCSNYNLDGRVDTVDFGIMQNHWFKTVGSSGCI